MSTCCLFPVEKWKAYEQNYGEMDLNRVLYTTFQEVVFLALQNQ